MNFDTSSGISHAATAAEATKDKDIISSKMSNNVKELLEEALGIPCSDALLKDTLEVLNKNKIKQVLSVSEFKTPKKLAAEMAELEKKHSEIQKELGSLMTDSNGESNPAVKPVIDTECEDTGVSIEEINMFGRAFGSILPITVTAMLAEANETLKYIPAISSIIAGRYRVNIPALKAAFAGHGLNHSDHTEIRNALILKVMTKSLETLNDQIEKNGITDFDAIENSLDAIRQVHESKDLEKIKAFYTGHSDEIAVDLIPIIDAVERVFDTIVDDATAVENANQPTEKAEEETSS
jgi:hypothetical protein